MTLIGCEWHFVLYVSPFTTSEKTLKISRTFITFLNQFNIADKLKITHNIYINLLKAKLMKPISKWFMQMLWDVKRYHRRRRRSPPLYRGYIICMYIDPQNNNNNQINRVWIKIDDNDKIFLWLCSYFKKLSSNKKKFLTIFFSLRSLFIFYGSTVGMRSVTLYLYC